MSAGQRQLGKDGPDHGQERLPTRALYRAGAGRA